MLIEGDIIRFENKEYKVRHSVNSLLKDDVMYWLEPVVCRTENVVFTGGMNIITHYSDMEDYEYISGGIYLIY